MAGKRWTSKAAALVVALIASLIALAFWGRAIAGPLDDAAAAYERGDYATAARLYLPLAEQGSAQAQYSLGFMYATGRGVAAGQCGGNQLVSQGSRAGACKRAEQSRRDLRRGARRAAGSCGSSAVVSPRRRAGQCARAEQSRLHVCQWPGRAAGLRRGGKVVRPGGRAGRRERAIQPGTFLCERSRRRAGRCCGAELVSQGR